MKVTLLSAIGVFWIVCVVIVAWITAVQPKDDPPTKPDNKTRV